MLLDDPTYVRGVVMCEDRDTLAQAIADTITGKRQQQDAYAITNVAVVFRTDAPQYIEFSIMRTSGGTRAWLHLCDRRSHYIVVSRRYEYPAAADADEIAQDAAGRFWAMSEPLITTIRTGGS